MPFDAASVPDARPAPTPPDAPADWVPIAEHPAGAAIAHYADRSFLGQAGAERLQVRHLARTALDGVARLRVEVTYGALAQGPPGHAHGGSTAAILDEALGVAAWLARTPAVAAHLAVDFRAPIPLGTTAYVEPELEALDARKARVRGRLVSAADGTVFAEATGVFVFLDERHRGRFAGGGA